MNKEIIRKKIREYLNENDSFKNIMKRRQELINSIKSFNDIDDNKILEIFEYFGTEGYNNEEDAFDDFKDKVTEWKMFSDPQLLYRVVGVKNKKLINTDELGYHWTQYKWNLDSDMLMSIGYENWDNNTKPFVIEALVPLSEINVLQTVIQNLAFPNEHEIHLNNAGKNIKFIKAYKLKGF